MRVFLRGLVWSVLLLLFGQPVLAGPLTLQFWHSMSGEKGALLRDIVAQFNALPDNAGKVKVELQARKASDYFWRIRADVIAQLTHEGFYKKYPAAKTAIDQLRASPDTPATRGALLGIYPEAREHIDSAIEQILTSHVSVETALGRAKAQTEAAIVRYNRGRNAS